MLPQRHAVAATFCPTFAGYRRARARIFSHAALPKPVASPRRLRLPCKTSSVARRASGSDAEAAFDKQAFLRREEFDFLSAQNFRREALIQYRNTNQSEPLRIGLSLFVTFLCFCAPFLAPSNADLPFYVAVVVVALASGAFFLRERGKRTRQLERLQREYSLGDLSVELSDPATQGVRRRTMQSLRSSRRAVALYGSRGQLREALAAAAPYRRRFQQSAVLVVPVSAGEPAEAQEAASEALGGAAGVKLAGGWLAGAASPQRWRAYFEELLEDRGGAAGRGTWVALSFKGRVIGSNFGSPVWDELFAAMPPDIPPLSTEPASSTAAPAEVLEAQAEFYRALCTGDNTGMRKLFLREDDAELSFALEADAAGATNLSGWDVVLAEGARPELVIASQDAVLSRPGEAVTTCIEFPVLGPTLLATQTWRRVPSEGQEGMSWRLVTHRTIPYAPRVEARVALRCDHRGCIAFGKQLDAMQ